MEVPCLLSIDSSNISRLRVSIGKWASLTVSGLGERRGTTLPLALSTNCSISLTYPFAGPIICPSSSRLKGKGSVRSQK